jgi:hypothetical protein
MRIKMTKRKTKENYIWRGIEFFNYYQLEEIDNLR